MVSVLGRIKASDHNQPEQSYTPELLAATTDPTLGTGSIQLGRFYQDPITGKVTGDANVRFGTAGVNPGSGLYRMTLPTPVDNMSTSTTLGVADILGYGIFRDNSSSSAGSRLIIAHRLSSTGGPGGVGTVQLAICDGVSSAISDSNPAVMAAEDSFSIHFEYIGTLP